MRPVKLLLFSCLIFSACPLLSSAQSDVVDFKALQQVIENSDKKIKVINFWATWCGPCVKELPLFEDLNKNRKDVAVILVSVDLDLNPDVSVVRSFVEKRKIESKVLMIREQNAADWIPKINSEWTGALPATLIINRVTGKRTFVERSLHEGELETEIEKLN